MDTQIAELRKTVELGFAGQRRISDERHKENRVRLQRIEDQCRQTNGRVSTAEADIRHLQDGARGDGDQKVTLPALKWWLLMVGGSISATYWILTSVAGFHR